MKQSTNENRDRAFEVWLMNIKYMSLYPLNLTGRLELAFNEGYEAGRDRAHEEYRDYLKNQSSSGSGQ